MKTIVKTIALTVAMSAVAGAAAQTGTLSAASAPDTVLLSETVDGDYRVRRLRIRSTDDVDYSIRYRISAATLNAALAGNAVALGELDGFVDGLMQDTLKQVSRIVITGYASPDGPVAYNRELAAQRAADFRTYMDRKYNLSQRYAVTVTSEADDWAMAHAAIASSSVPERAAVLQIVDGSQAPMAKEQALKRLPGVWNYLAREVLPPMRRVEVMIGYDTSRIVEERTLIPRPAPAPAPQQDDYVVVEEDVSGVIVEMPKKEYREEQREAKRDVKEAGQLVKHDSREAAKIARAQEKAAKRIAKKEAKAAKKAARAAKKTYKDLEKM